MEEAFEDNGNSNALEQLGVKWPVRAGAGIDTGKVPGVHYYSAMLLNQEAMTREEHQRASGQMKKELEVAVALSPDFADAYALLGEAHSYAGEYDDAIASSKKAMTLSPRNERYALSLAHYYAAAKRWDEAIALLMVLRNSPDFRISVNAVEQLRAIERSKNQSPQMREPCCTDVRCGHRTCSGHFVNW